jgi:phosphatidylglycerophosphatase C
MSISIEDDKPIVAAFDFDGTITKRDTLLSFLVFTAGKWQTTKKLILLIPQFVKFLIAPNGARQETKETVLKSFFKGLPEYQLHEMGEAFASSSKLDNLIHPSALKRIEWHRKQKHRCVLISASIDAYLIPWSLQKKFDDLICSKLEIDNYGIVTGMIDGANCWGPEKERRLLKLLGPKENYKLFAYGDSRGDLELLSLADFPFFRKMPSPGI